MFGDYSLDGKNNINTITKSIFSKNKKAIGVHFPKLKINQNNLVFKASTIVPPYYHTSLYYFDKKGEGIDSLIVDSLQKVLVYCKTSETKQYLQLFWRDKNENISQGLKNESLSIFETFKTDSNYVITPPDNSFTLASEAIKKGANYLATIRFLRKIENDYTSDLEKWMYQQTKLTYNSFVQNNEENERLLSQFYIKSKAINNILAYDSSALEYIKIQIKDRQVVMINEQHWQPKHRYLGNMLLKSFYDAGFRYLAVEAVLPEKEVLADLNERKYPLQNSGFYTKEPNFGNFIRNALEMGFMIVGYDVKESDREYKQALNIYNNTVAIDPDAKVLVWAGVGHVIEKESESPNMAYYFKKISGINPLTIEQTRGDYCTKELPYNNLAIINDTTMKDFCDIFIINNIRAKDFRVKPEDKNNMHNIVLSSDIKPHLKKHKQLILSVFCKSEYEKHEFDAVPVLNHMITNLDNIRLELPTSNSYIGIIRTPYSSIIKEYNFD